MPSNYSDSLWDQFEVVYKRIQDGKEFMKKTSHFLKSLSSIERDYSSKISSLLKSTEADYGTVNTAWSALKEELEKVSQKHKDIADNVSSQAYEPENQWLLDNKRPRLNTRDQGRKLLKDLSAAEKNLASAKKAYEDMRRKQDEYKDAYEKESYSSANSKNAEKLSKQLKQQTLTADKGDKKYREAVATLDAVQLRYFEDEMPNLLRALQEMEVSRITCVKTTLTSCVRLYEDNLPEVIKCYNSAHGKIDQINSNSDIEAFSNEKTTRNSKPPRVQYEPYSTAHSKCVPEGTAGAVAPVTAIASPGRAAPSTNSTPINSNPSSSVKDVSAPAAAASSGPQGYCKALYDYTTTDENELAFKAGDVITILQKDPSGWWQGELNGKIGVFPSVDWVEEISSPAGGAAAAAAAPAAAAATSRGAPTPTQANPNCYIGGKCKALYPYKAETEWELSINEGDVLTIESEEDGWFSGRNDHGQFGRYPSNFIQPL